MKNNTARKPWTTPRILEVSAMSEAQGAKGSFNLIEAIINVGGIFIVAGPAS